VAIFVYCLLFVFEAVVFELCMKGVVEIKQNSIETALKLVGVFVLLRLSSRCIILAFVFTAELS